MSETVLERKLDEFREAMLAKFREVEHKHPDDSVTKNDFDWSLYPLRPVDEHYVREIFERFFKAQTNAERRKEDVDVANLAFLSWALRGARAVE